jgi:hypothetical protein
MLSDDDDDGGFRWGRAVFGALLGLIGAFIFVKVGESKWWWLLVPVSTAVFGFRLDIPWWLPWIGSDNETTPYRSRSNGGTHTIADSDAGATTTADSGGGDGAGNAGGNS